MKLETRIINYINSKTGGTVILKEEDAKQIISFVENPEPRAIAILYMFTWSSGLPAEKRIRTAYTTKEKIDAVIADYKNKKIEGSFYRWDLYSENGKMIASINSINSSLF